MSRKVKRWDVIIHVLKTAKINPLSGAEIGTKRGRTARHLLDHFKQLTMYCIDLWEPQPDNKAETYENWDFAQIKADFQKNTAQFKKRCVAIQDDSFLASMSFEDCSLDFVFIDGQHDWLSVTNDLRAWVPKVRKGGVVFGHDWQADFPDVQKAATDFFGEDNVHTGEDSMWWTRV